MRVGKAARWMAGPIVVVAATLGLAAAPAYADRSQDVFVCRDPGGCILRESLPAGLPDLATTGANALVQACPSVPNVPALVAGAACIPLPPADAALLLAEVSVPLTPNVDAGVLGFSGLTYPVCNHAGVVAFAVVEGVTPEVTAGTESDDNPDCNNGIQRAF
jgi:hypothetical protein